jgi:hypothetical protein
VKKIKKFFNDSIPAISGFFIGAVIGKLLHWNIDSILMTSILSMTAWLAIYMIVNLTNK